jgi:hypothetical protein
MELSSLGSEAPRKGRYEQLLINRHMSSAGLCAASAWIGCCEGG